MPFYTWLRPGLRDDVDTLNTKRRAAKKIKALRDALEAHIHDAALPDGVEQPSDTSRYVRIATWNIREFDSSSYGYRSQEAKAYIAEILSHFDLIALQEIRRDLDALDDVKRLLGPNWNYIATDVTEGDFGNQERMAFLFNHDKVWFRNVAGELTLPRGQKVTDPFGDRFKVEGGARVELPAGRILVSPTGLKTGILLSGQTKVEEDVEITLPAGTKIILPAGSSIRFAKNARVPITAARTKSDASRRSSPTAPRATAIRKPTHIS